MTTPSTLLLRLYSILLAPFHQSADPSGPSSVHNPQSAIRAVVFDNGGVMIHIPYDKIKASELAFGLTTDKEMALRDAIRDTPEAFNQMERGEIIGPEYESIHLRGFIERKIIESVKVGMNKPHANIYEHAQKLLNLKPDEIVFLDDTLINVEGARKVGWHAIHVPKQDYSTALVELEKVLGLKTGALMPE